ncbi:hypothetical protein [Xenorhabdus bovienii]|uniref:Uncharacterized protein n=1 Tax=Xenorhabdus bovienii str. puntauvense TaxID=1398201 RepID=A0A077NC75_XENBV|nr:hypothetical protein [Xenorhabdus bovienii]CDG90087.1 conserved hypothetical protein [Xenorhabdus bovienii str. feltiae France]CDG91395.1 conserved hypothetical protein [Xenorhabdus bovienii str. feltiae Florida]CDG95560.1 conserved hypothetical protein [Xenorhabdus bovienii str. puntauvense]
MENISLLARRRKSFINAFFDHLRKKGKASSFKRTVNSIEYQIDLDDKVFIQALITLYENKACKAAGMNEQQIINYYAEYFNNYGNLTPAGKEFISFITELIAKQLHQKDLDNDKAKK